VTAFILGALVGASAVLVIVAVWLLVMLARLGDGPDL